MAWPFTAVAIALAPSKGIRLICVNRRDYADTTLFSAEELGIIANGDKEARLNFIKERALEYSTLVTELIEKYSIPAPDVDKTRGGIALMGWSFGNTVPLGIASAIETYPPSIKEILQKYLIKIIIHNAPAVALGIPHPSDTKTYPPYADPNIPPEKREDAFMHWASGYFDNGDLSLQNVHALPYDVFPTETTFAHMSIDERASTVDSRPMFRSETILGGRFQNEFLEQTRRTLCDHTLRVSLPLMEVRLLYGDSVSWSIVYAVWEVEKMAREADVRTVESIVLNGKNTFMFWDHPDESLNALVSLCQK
ncbi:hypothetical protein Clacol_004827 [Clathrus columnatus]|uniref:AB hydrolase-1 domain-containing protein n=1 Tax=Clathrus columnatus TaxID=1419009 RepID=A0AAV5AF73_9AGAM|nr:hypothetical protein Clacol_004827 [Clathrus columnatus]